MFGFCDKRHKSLQSEGFLLFYRTDFYRLEVNPFIFAVNQVILNVKALLLGLIIVVGRLKAFGTLLSILFIQ